MEDLKVQETEVVEQATEQPEVVEDNKEAVIASEDNKETNEPKQETKEEMITMSKAEFEQRLNNKFIEGQRKATKANDGELKTQLEQANAQNQSLINELNSLKNVLKMDELSIDKDKQEDLIAILKGKGLEINEATIMEEALRHPEWKKKAETSGITLLGQTKETESERVKRENQMKKDRAAFGLK